MGVFGSPSGAAWAELAAAGIAMEAIEKVRAAVEALGGDVHKALDILKAHLPPAPETSSGNPDAPWDGP